MADVSHTHRRVDRTLQTLKIPHDSRNGCAPSERDISSICDLCPDLLGQIFFELVDADWRGLRQVKITWVRIMLVCRFWRDVGLNFPKLWSYVSCGHHPDWVSLTLERSKSYPLVVDVWIDGNIKP